VENMDYSMTITNENIEVLKRGIPSYVTNLIIEYSTRENDNDIIQIPNTITNLTLLHSDLLHNLFIPNTLKHITIRYIITLFHSIPNHITKLTLENIYIPLKPGFLPNGLYELIIQKDIYYPLNKQDLPTSLHTLVFGYFYNFSFPYLPNLKFIFGCKINHDWNERKENDFSIIQILGNPMENILCVYINGDCITIRCIKEYYLSGFLNNYIELLESIQHHLRKSTLGTIIFEDLIQNRLHPRHLIKFSLLYNNATDFYEAIEKYLL